MDNKRKKIELLAPAGDFEALEAAVNAGADAVYLGFGGLNARRRAEGFSASSLAEAVRFAHLRDVKVYVTLNILLRQSELKEYLETAEAACKAGVDALIIQDWGALSLAREAFPGMRLHASTQINAHNGPTLDLLETAGYARATLARETSLEEMARLSSEHSIEIEAFAHGALCFSYSGQCLMSSLVGGRSGNRGLCPQACRMAYEIFEGGRQLNVPGRHPLSMRDLSALPILDELADAGIASLKIEGRLKSSQYVGTVTNVYRRALDRLAAGAFAVSDEEIEEVEIAFNRGFTQGHLRGEQGGTLISYHRPSDRGVMIGRVAFCDPYSGDVGITLQKSLHLGDEIEFWVTRGGRIKSKVESLTVEGHEVEAASPGSRAVVKVKDMRHKIGTGDRAFVVSREPRLGKRKTIPIRVHVSVAEGELPRITASLEGLSVEVVGESSAQTARTKPLTKDGVARQLEKLGDTPYSLEELDVTITGEPALPVSEINALRRAAIEKLDTARLSKYKRLSCSIKAARELLDMTSTKPAKKIPHLEVSTGEIASALAAIEAGADSVYLKLYPGFVSPEALQEIANNPRIYPAFGNIEKDDEVESVISLAGSLPRSRTILCDNAGLAAALGAMGFNVALDYHVGVLNGVAARELGAFSPSGLTASVEADESDLAHIVGGATVPVAVVAHGSIEVMVAEHSLLESAAEESKAFRRAEIVDAKGFHFPVTLDPIKRTHTYNAKELCLLEELPALVKTGVGAIRLLLELYSLKAVSHVVDVYRRALDEVSETGGVRKALADASSAHKSFSDHTSGHFYKPVD